MGFGRVWLRSEEEEGGDEAIFGHGERERLFGSDFAGDWWRNIKLLKWYFGNLK
jgi:hypothetical protein